MTTTAAAGIEQAVGLLLEVCDGASARDGQGFNGFDSNFVRDLWPKRGSWSINQLAALYTILGKYKRQLTALGFDFDSLAAPAAALAEERSREKAAKPGVVIKVNERGTIVVTFPWKPETVELVRSIPGRVWHGDAKEWHVPAQPQSLDGLVRFAQQTDAELPEGLVLAHKMAAEAIEAAEAQAEASTAASVATDADLHVKGLGGTLMPFQRAGVKYMAEGRRVLNGDEMGLGKTPQALATLHHLGALPALVVCPASLRTNWMREARKWLPGTYAAPYEVNSFGDVGVITYDLLPKWADHICAKIVAGKLKGVVFDEAHYLKNHKAKRSEAAKQVAVVMRRTRQAEAVLLALTGTPILNRPAELLHLVQLLGRLDDLGGWKTFVDRYLQGGFGGNGSNLPELQKLCRATFLIRREKAQVLKDLPPKRRLSIKLAMTDLPKYQRLERAPLPDNEAAAIVRIGELRKEAARQKLPAGIAWVREFLETGKKLVLFAHHREVQAELVKAFPGCVHVFGEDDGAARQRAVDRFQEDPNVQLIVCSLKAAGVGLTLTAASDVAFFEYGWTPGDMDQAEDRTHRIGQRESVTAWNLEGEGADIDADMLALIEEKREVSNQLLQHGRTLAVEQASIKDRLVASVLAKAKGGKPKK